MRKAGKLKEEFDHMFVFFTLGVQCYRWDQICRHLTFICGHLFSQPSNLSITSSNSALRNDTKWKRLNATGPITASAAINSVSRVFDMFLSQTATPDSVTHWKTIWITAPANVLKCDVTFELLSHKSKGRFPLLLPSRSCVIVHVL